MAGTCRCDIICGMTWRLVFLSQVVFFIAVVKCCLNGSRMSLFLTNSIRCDLFQEMFSQSFIKFTDIWHLRIIPVISCFSGFILPFKITYKGNSMLSDNTANCTVTYFSFPCSYDDGFCACFFNGAIRWHVKVNWPLICFILLALYVVQSYAVHMQWGFSVESGGAC